MVYVRNSNKSIILSLNRFRDLGAIEKNPFKHCEDEVDTNLNDELKISTTCRLVPDLEFLP